MLLLVEFATCVIGAFVLTLFLFVRKKSLAYKWIGIHFAIPIYMICNRVMYESGNLIEFPHMINSSATLGYLIGPVSYFFIRALFEGDQARMRKKDLWHLIPFLLHFIELLPFYLSNGQYKTAFLNNILSQGNKSWLEIYHNPIYGVSHNLAKFIISLVYIYFSFQILNRQRRSTTAPSQLENNSSLRMASQFLWIKVIVHIFMMLEFILMNIHIIQFGFLTDFTLIMVILSNTVLFVLNPELMYGFKGTPTTPAKEDLLQNDYVIHGFNSGLIEESIFINTNYEIVYFNKSANEMSEKILGVSLKNGENIGRYLRFLKKSFKVVFVSGFSKALQGQTFQFEYLLNDHEKNLNTWRLLDFKPMKDDQEKIVGVIFTFKDITEIKARENSIDKYKTQLDDIIWQQSHLVRSPVANILGISSLLLKPDASLAIDEKISLLRHVHHEVKRLDNTIFKIVQNANDVKNHS